MKRLSLRHLNNVLSLIAVGLCVYILAYPFWPKATFRWKPTPPLAQPKPQAPKQIPEQNTLVIPNLKLQETIHEGRESWTLNKGVWHTPRSSRPDVGGNMILTGHRFTYGGPAVFYHLDKLKKGDDIVIYWQKKKFEYRVASILVVPPSATQVLGQTSDSRLTIYTCTPLVTAKNRLIIQADPKTEVAP
jgi:sortase A